MFDLTPLGNRYFAAYNPFKEMEDFENNFFGRQVPTFKTDIKENDHAFIIEAELPGYTKEDIRAEVKNGYPTIYAERKNETEEKKSEDKYIRKERFYGSYRRSFKIEGIKSNEITASHKDGILTLTLPKIEKKEPEPIKLEIN